MHRHKMIQLPDQMRIFGHQSLSEPVELGRNTSDELLMNFEAGIVIIVSQYQALLQLITDEILLFI